VNAYLSVWPTYRLLYFEPRDGRPQLRIRVFRWDDLQSTDRLSLGAQLRHPARHTIMIDDVYDLNGDGRWGRTQAGVRRSSWDGCGYNFLEIKLRLEADVNGSTGLTQWL